MTQRNTKKTLKTKKAKNNLVEEKEEKAEKEAIEGIVVSDSDFDSDLDSNDTLENSEDTNEEKNDESDLFYDDGEHEQREEQHDLLPIDQTIQEISERAVKGQLKADTPLLRYLKEIGRFKLLTIEEEKELTKALKETGDINIAKRLVEANLRLVVKIAMEYRHSYQNLLDLIQEGNIGLMKAVSKYDPDKGAKLSYYASWWIRSYILKFILDNFRLVKIGTTNEQKKLFYNLLKEKDRLTRLGISPENKLISENLGVSEKAVALMDERLSGQAGSGHNSTHFGGGNEISLDRPLTGLDGSTQKGTLGDILEDPNSVPLDELLDNTTSLKILKEHLESFVQTLKDRDREIFEKRLLMEVPASLQAIANEYGVSRERIRQIEERLIQKLKGYMAPHLR